MEVVLSEFLVGVQKLWICDLQLYPFGAAYVKFNSVHDIDAMINTSPHQFDDVEITFKRNSEGLNGKGLAFNRECYLMLVGFPLDYWSMSYIQDAIKSFGKLLVSKKDLNNLALIIIKGRVLDLDQVSKSIQIIDGDGLLSESWIVPCEVIYWTLLGGGPPNEDSPLEDGGDPHPPPPMAWNHQIGLLGLGEDGANGGGGPGGLDGGQANLAGHQNGHQ